MHWAGPLRRDLAERALTYAQANSLPHSISYGEMPVVCFAPSGSLHGNFSPASFKAILANPGWHKRLAKVHAQGRKSLPTTDRGRWMELDTCTSSDALLMNIFCHPATPLRLWPLLGVASDIVPEFGYKARVPLINGRFDRTEVDMFLGDLLVEAKLTESDFQRVNKPVLATYRDFHDVFDEEQLPQTEQHYLSYQLLRNVLAAHALECSFCVLLDARRPDLIEDWYAIMKCVKLAQLRTALRVLTWQDLAQFLSPQLQLFLAKKYGIEPAT
jgi:restriction endonuclease-like protein